jgi:hypothetical protein
MFEDAKNSDMGKRNKETLIINSLFNKDGKGKLTLDLSKPIFTQDVRLLS